MEFKLAVPAVAAFTMTPFKVFLAITLASPATIPPTILLAPSVIETPFNVLPKVMVCALSVPIKLPCIVLLFEANISIPFV